MTQMALGYPEVGFSLTSGGRRLLECPPAPGLRERFFHLFGERADLVEVRKEAGGLTIHGYVAALGDQGPVRGAQNVFVNRRIVKDRTIAHAIGEAYSVATIKERSPEVHFFVQIPPERVDVNVHPTKAEVRFLEQSLVHEVLRRGLGEALGQGRAPELQFTPFAPRPRRAAPDGDTRCARGRDRGQPVDDRSALRAAWPPPLGVEPAGSPSRQQWHRRRRRGGRDSAR